jgi:dimethylargininase
LDESTVRRFEVCVNPGKSFQHAIVRTPGGNFAEGLTTAGLGEPDLPKVLVQHAAYCDALEKCGLRLVRLEADLDHPDSTFVEDTAVVMTKSAVLARPGAPSRLGEVATIRDILGRFYSTMHEIKSPGTLDGGDICEAGSHFFLGISHRTNHEGARQLGEILAAEGYTSSLVDIRNMSSILHLKSGMAYLENDTLVVMEELADRREFERYSLIRVPTGESYACNCVWVNDWVLLPTGFPQVEAALVSHGYKPLLVDMSEFRKMDGGLSCLSLRF